MDSTPPSLRSNPRSALRLAKNNKTLVKSHIPSLDLVLSNNNDNTPYPSPVSLSSPSSPVTLRQILLLSPSPLRKSRTRLTNRFDKEAVEAGRRCKTKGGQDGLLASASPRNRRRPRRRTEEVKEDNVETPKPTKQNKSGRSKKEKDRLVPSCPSSELNVCQGDLERIRENINDLIMWRDVAKSTLWFGLGSICFLSSCFAKGVNFRYFDFTVNILYHIHHLFIIIFCFLKCLLRDFISWTFVSRGIFLSNTIRQRVKEEGARRELKLSEEDVLRIARRVLPVTNLAISKTSELFSGEPAMTLKVAPFVIIGAEYGYLITLWRLCALGFFLSFTVPKLYSCYAGHINRKVEIAQKRIVEAWGICTHKKIVAGSIVTAFWNLSSLKTRVFTVFIIVVVIRCKRQIVEPDSVAEEEKQEEQTVPEQQESAIEVVVMNKEAEGPKKL